MLPDDPPLLVKALVTFALMGSAIWTVWSWQKKKSPRPAATPPPLPPEIPTDPEAARLSPEERARLHRDVDALLGDRKNDKAFMAALNEELERLRLLGEDGSELEHMLMGYVLGMVEFPRLCSALYRARPVLLARPGDEKKVPLAVDRPDGHPYLALFTEADKAEKAFAEFPEYTRMGEMKTPDIMEIFKIVPEDSGFIINPFDPVLTVTFTPPMRASFIAAMALIDRKDETPPQPPEHDLRPIRLAVGPSPWAWRDRSHVMGGQKYRFRGLEADEELAGITKVLNENDEVILLLDFYHYARFLDDGRVLLWWEDARSETKTLCFAAFRFRDLPAIPDPMDAARRMRAEKRDSSGLPGAVEWKVACLREAGDHEIDSPEEWRDFEETLALAAHARSEGYPGMHRALFVFDWKDRRLTVLPQDWFNEGNYDFDYQGITRIARTESGEFIGEGVRLGTFVLDESGRRIGRWISENPFHMIS